MYFHTCSRCTRWTPGPARRCGHTSRRCRSTAARAVSPWLTGWSWPACPTQRRRASRRHRRSRLDIQGPGRGARQWVYLVSAGRRQWRGGRAGVGRRRIPAGTDHRPRREDRQSNCGRSLRCPAPGRPVTRPGRQDSDIWQIRWRGRLDDAVDRPRSRAWRTSARAMPCRRGVAKLRAGDNLFTSSVLALDLKTGKMALALSAHASRIVGGGSEHAVHSVRRDGGWAARARRSP